MGLLLSLGALIAQAGDYNGHWAESQIEQVKDLGIVVGYENGDIKPDSSITRAEFVTVVNKTFGFTVEGSTGFRDIAENSWYASQFKIAKEAGYVKGDDQGQANPDDLITRAEASVMLYQAAELTGETGLAPGFADNMNIPSWALTAVGVMNEKKIIAGYPDGSFRPNSSITRAEAFTIICNILNSQEQQLVAPTVPIADTVNSDSSGMLESPVKPIEASGGSGSGEVSVFPDNPDEIMMPEGENVLPVIPLAG